VMLSIHDCKELKAKGSQGRQRPTSINQTSKGRGDTSKALESSNITIKIHFPLPCKSEKLKKMGGKANGPQESVNSTSTTKFSTIHIA
jgi:hypothetical protein